MTSDLISNLPFFGFAESRQGGRPENQDSMGCSDTPLGFLVLVCDGMGGGPGGKTASLIATQTIIEFVKSCNPETDRQKALTEAIFAANEAVLKKAESIPELTGMGTTVIALLINQESAVVANVGDSRLYKLKGLEKTFRTQDHSLVADMVRKKSLTEEQARLSAQSNVITRAIGSGNGNCQPNLYELAYEKGDRFVLCTDGIWGSMPEKVLLRKFTQRGQVHKIVEAVAMEVDEHGMANGNHHDNLTLAMVQTKDKSKLKENMTKKGKLIVMALAVLLVLSFVFNIRQTISIDNSSKAKERVTQLSEELGVKDSIIHLFEDSIKHISSEFQSALKEAKDLAQGLQTDQLEQIKILTKENAELKSQISKLNEATQTQTNKHTQGTVSTAKKRFSNSELVKKLNKLKSTEASKEEFMKKLEQNKKAVIAYIDSFKDKQPTGLAEVRKLANERWDTFAKPNDKTRKWSLTDDAKNKIDKIIEKANNIK